MGVIMYLYSMKKGHVTSLPLEYTEGIIKYYSTGKGITEISRIYKTSPCKIKTVLRENGVYVKNISEIKRKFSVDETYFEKIDTPNKAYFLGLMYADGHNNVKTGQIVLNLQERDVAIIKKFKEDIKYTGNIGTWKKQPPRQNQRTLNIRSTKLTKDLEKLGCTQQKTLVLKYPYWMDKELQLHFIRGFFDGDGTIVITGKYSVAMSFIAIKDMAIGISKYLSEIIGKKVPVGEYAKGRYTIEDLRAVRVAGKKDIKKIMDAWYKDTNTYLQRKYDKYYEAFYIKKLADYELYTSNCHTGKNAGGGNPVIQYDLKGNILGRYNTIKRASEETGVTEGYIINVCRKAQKSKEIINLRADYKKNLLWIYEKDISEEPPTVKFIKLRDMANNFGTKIHKRSVIQYDINMNQIKELEYLTDCIKEGFDPSSVTKVCRGKFKTHKGYIWRYKY